MAIDVDGLEAALPRMMAKVAGGSFSIEWYGSVTVGMVNTYSQGMGADKYGNIALFRSTTNGPSVGMDISASTGIKAQFLPGFSTIDQMLGEGNTFTVSGGLKAAIPLGAGASLEFDANEQLAGFGLQLDLGLGVAPATWSFENNLVTATVFSKEDFGIFKESTKTAAFRARKRIQKYNSLVVDPKGRPYGHWEIIDQSLDYDPVYNEEKGEFEENLYQAVITTTLFFKPTSGHSDRDTAKEIKTTQKEDLNIFFNKDDDGNLISTNFKTK